MKENPSQRRPPDRPISASKKILQNILQAIPALVSVIDRDYRIVFSNWRGGYEYVPPKLRKKGVHCYEAYYPGTTDKCEGCHIAQVFASGKAIVAEKCNPRVGPLEIHAFPIFDEDGKVVMAGEYLHDISARRQAEASLMEANKILEEIIYASPLAIIALDRRVNLTLWNPAAEEMFGWSKEEVMGRPYPIIPEGKWCPSGNPRFSASGGSVAGVIRPRPPLELVLANYIVVLSQFRTHCRRGTAG